LNKQGPDAGTQYRSEIFYHDDIQKNIATDKIKILTENQLFDNPIVTQVSELDVFYHGEDYHQDYFANNSMNPYCVYIINPKLQKFLLQNQPK
jgi:peptide-methionine (S)-S-oxide reductase